MQKQLAAELTLDVDFSNGQLVILLKQEGTDGGIELKGYVSSDRLFDKLAAKIPGSVDDAVIAVVKQAVKLVK